MLTSAAREKEMPYVAAPVKSCPPAMTSVPLVAHAAVAVKMLTQQEAPNASSSMQARATMRQLSKASSIRLVLLSRANECVFWLLARWVCACYRYIKISHLEVCYVATHMRLHCSNTRSTE
jgi:hypothetical protein